MKKSKSVIYKALLAFLFIFCFSPSANAGDFLRWLLSLIPSGQYGAVVTAESTGGGRVYVETSQDSSTSGSNQSVGAKSTTGPYTQVSFDLKAFADNGYIFAGWDDSNPSSGAYESTNSTYTIYVRTSTTAATSEEPNAAEYYRYAYFTPLPYTLTLKPGSHGQGSQTELDYNAQSTENLRDYLFTAEPGYQFKDWKVTVADGYWTPVGKTYNTTNIPLSAKYGSATLTEEWSATNYNITYNANGGKVNNKSLQTDYYSIESNGTVRTATRAGHTFSGWRVTSINTEGNWTLNQLIPAGTTLTGKYGTVTLTAQWDLNYGDLTIEVNGLQDGDSAMYNVSDNNGTVLYTVVVSASNPSVTIKELSAGSYTISPKSQWNSWKYNGTNATDTIDLDASGATFSVTYTPKSNVKKNDEKSNTNWQN